MEYFNDQKRQANIEELMRLLKDSETLTFNEVVFAFADLVQSTFMSAMFVGKTKEEREAIGDQITNLSHSLIDVLNTNSPNMMVDMIVFANLIMDAVENAEQARIAEQQN